VANSVLAAIGDGRGGLQITRLPAPRAAAGELLLRLRGAGLCGTDLWKLRQGDGAAGKVLGHEVVGTIEAIGDAVAGHRDDPQGPDELDGAAARNERDGTSQPWTLGERVVAVHHVACGSCHFCAAGSETMCAEFRHNLLVPGGFSELLVVQPSAVRHGVFRLPPPLADESAVFLEPAACVLRGIRRSGLGVAGHTADRTATRPVVAILGAGSMGLLHLLVWRALARRAAADQPSAATTAPLLIVSDALAERRGLAAALGADAVALPGADVRREVLARSQGRGADVVFDTVGGAGPLAEALELGRPGGTAVLFAHALSEAHAGLSLNGFFKSERRLVATYSSAPVDQQTALSLLVDGSLDPRPLISHRLPLSRAAEGVELARSHRALKVLLVPDGADGSTQPLEGWS
jgi:L-iditol 2-dehydrogenase